MKPDFHDHTGSCTRISEMLSRIGDKWSVLVVNYLGNGPLHFNELRREIGNITQKMLTSTLRNLERDGFIARTVSPSRPPRVEYALTDLGHALLVPVHELAQWTMDNAEKIDAARARFDAQDGETRSAAQS